MKPMNDQAIVICVTGIKELIKVNLSQVHITVNKQQPKVCIFVLEIQ